MRVTVRRLLRDGADCIKLCTSGGVVSPHDTPCDVELHRRGDRHGGLRGRPARQAGGEPRHRRRGHRPRRRRRVRSIEHGTLLTERQAAAMAAAGCWLVPDAVHPQRSDRRLLAQAERGVGGVAPSYAIKKVLELRDSFGECVRIAREAGVRIATGCDWIDRRQHGRNLEELALLHEAGLPSRRSCWPRPLERRRALRRRRPLRPHRARLRLRRHRARQRPLGHGGVPRQGDGPRGVQGRGRLPQRRRPAGGARAGPGPAEEGAVVSDPSAPHASSTPPIVASATGAQRGRARQACGREQPKPDRDADDARRAARRRKRGRRRGRRLHHAGDGADRHDQPHRHGVRSVLRRADGHHALPQQHGHVAPDAAAVPHLSAGDGRPRPRRADGLSAGVHARRRRAPRAFRLEALEDAGRARDPVGRGRVPGRRVHAGDPRVGARGEHLLPGDARSSTRRTGSRRRSARSCATPRWPSRCGVSPRRDPTTSPPAIGRGTSSRPRTSWAGRSSSGISRQRRRDGPSRCAIATGTTRSSSRRRPNVRACTAASCSASSGTSRSASWATTRSPPRVSTTWGRPCVARTSNWVTCRTRSSSTCRSTCGCLDDYHASLAAILRRSRPKAGVRPHPARRAHQRAGASARVRLAVAGTGSGEEAAGGEL